MLAPVDPFDDPDVRPDPVRAVVVVVTVEFVIVVFTTTWSPFLRPDLISTIPLATVPVITTVVVVSFSEPFFDNCTVDVPSLAVVIARTGSSSTSPVELVTMSAITDAPTKNCVGSALNTTITGNVATPDVALATEPTELTMPVAVAPVSVEVDDRAVVVV